MKKKLVIKMSLHDDKCRSKALKIAVCIPGVESAAITGEGKDQVEVIGERIDSVELTRRLRKKMGHAELLSLGEANIEQTTEAEAETEEAVVEPVVNMVAPPYYGCPNYYYEVRDPNPCTIL